MAETTRRTLIEEGTAIEGNVNSQCPVELCGKVQGEVQAPSLSVTRSGSVNGKVKVKELRSEGEISGEINADAVELSGTVKDDTVIQAKTLEVKLSQQSGMQIAFGNCRLQVSGDRAEDGAQKSQTQQAQQSGSSQSNQQRNESQREHAHSGNPRHGRR